MQAPVSTNRRPFLFGGYGGLRFHMCMMCCGHLHVGLPISLAEQCCPLATQKVLQKWLQLMPFHLRLGPNFVLCVFVSLGLFTLYQQSCAQCARQEIAHFSLSFLVSLASFPLCLTFCPFSLSFEILSFLFVAFSFPFLVTCLSYFHGVGVAFTRGASFPQGTSLLVSTFASPGDSSTDLLGRHQCCCVHDGLVIRKYEKF
jgi:hypothetical protein